MNALPPSRPIRTECPPGACVCDRNALLQDRMEQQLGIRLTIAPGPNEVRTLRGITILVHEQRGLCRKTRQSIPAAIRQALERRPEISYELLDEGGLFGAI